MTFVVAIPKDWKKGRALVGRRWPWMLGTAGRGVQLPPSAALGCPSDIPSCLLCQCLCSLGATLLKSLCAPTAAAQQETALGQRLHLSLLMHHSCLLQLVGTVR